MNLNIAVLGTGLYRPVQLVNEELYLIYRVKTVWWHISIYSKTWNFLHIPVDECIALAVLHYVEGHSYSAVADVLWLYSIAPVEELCVKGHSCTHIHLCTQDRS